MYTSPAKRERDPPPENRRHFPPPLAARLSCGGAITMKLACNRREGQTKHRRDQQAEATMHAITSSSARRILAATVLGLTTIGIAAAPRPANAWGHGGVWCCSAGVYVPPVYAPPPVYYAPPARAWSPAHWDNGYWIPGHWS